MSKTNELLYKYLTTVINWLLKIKGKLLKQNDLPNSIFYEDLSPSILDDGEVESYNEAIVWALENKNIKNMALTGPYGSGKSSILETFKESNNNYEYLNISLASFDISKQNIKKETVDRLIERSILQQIFYRVKYKKIPDSRFKRIVNIKLQDLIIQSILFVIWVLATTLIFNPELYEKINLGGNAEFLDNLWLNYLSFIVFILGAIRILVFLFRVINKVRLNKLNFKSGEIEINEKSNVSILNDHLDEILYFFEVNPFNVVIIEDLDRFSGSDIFTKLRELNLLLNNSKEIDRHIVFIYAIKDDMFLDKKNRTKFFDFILPVIPVINSSNSYDKILKKIQAFGLKDVLSNDLLSDISLYIDDMRMLKNIFNEFALYKDKLGGINLDFNKLLAIIIYKNIYPKDFSLLHLNKGLVFEAFKNKNKLIDERIENINKEQGQIEVKLKLVDESFIDNIRE